MCLERCSGDQAHEAKGGPSSTVNDLPSFATVAGSAGTVRAESQRRPSHDGVTKVCQLRTSSYGQRNMENLHFGSHMRLAQASGLG